MNDFLSLLDIESSPKAEVFCKDINSDFHENSDFNEDSDSDDFLNKTEKEMKFNMTLSTTELNSLFPSDVMNKRKQLMES